MSCFFDLDKLELNQYILFLAWTRVLKRDQLEPFSAGIRPAGVDPRAVRALAKAEIDISKPKDINSIALPVFFTNALIIGRSKYRIGQAQGWKRQHRIGNSGPGG
jgi:hypothetical protein